MKIALTHTGNPEKHQFYVDWLKSNENIEVIKVSAEDNNLDEIKNCDGLVLSGGVDIHPKFYAPGKMKYDGAPEKFNEPRDEFEIAAFNAAKENKLPILGICRGLQLINVIHKGTLIQNFSEKNVLDQHVGNPDKSHTVTIKEGTLLSQIVKDDEVEINSAHHQAIDKLGDGLMINAVSDDGIIEGVEKKDKKGPFLLAIQWHPERMFRFGLENTAASLAIRNKFIEEVKKSMHPK